MPTIDQNQINLAATLKALGVLGPPLDPRTSDVLVQIKALTDADKVWFRARLAIECPDRCVLTP